MIIGVMGSTETSCGDSYGSDGPDQTVPAAHSIKQLVFVTPNICNNANTIKDISSVLNSRWYTFKKISFTHDNINPLE